MIDDYKHIVLCGKDKASVALMFSTAQTKTASSLWKQQKAATRSAEQPAETRACNKTERHACIFCPHPHNSMTLS